MCVCGTVAFPTNRKKEENPKGNLLSTIFQNGGTFSKVYKFSDSRIFIEIENGRPFSKMVDNKLILVS